MSSQPGTTPAAPRRGRPRSAAKRQAILTAATDAFLRHGYQAATLDVVAACAGVSKQTIYGHFTDKQTLFVAVVEAARATTGDPAILGLRWRLDPADVRGSLTAFGEALLTTTLTAEVAGLRRVMIAELHRRPVLRELWNSGAPNATVTHFAAEVAALGVRGVLSIPSVPLAVEQYLALLGHPANMRSLFGVVPLTESVRRDIAASAADMFVRAYGRAGGSTV
jgi:TetR/AcrR family transcriptional regulator, mexJK operon transcriptional repressor